MYPRATPLATREPTQLDILVALCNKVAMPHVYTAPQPFDDAPDAPSVFLAGSIEQGTAVEWQRSVIDALCDRDCVVFNPRRASWNRELRQSITEPEFAEQVRWELDAL